MLEMILGGLVGAGAGSGVNKATPALDAGPAFNGISGLLGGLAGAGLLGGDTGWLTEMLGNSEWAGSLLGGGLGGVILAAVVGFLKNKVAG